MKMILRLLVSAMGLIIFAYILPGVKVEDFLTAIIVAVVLGILNAILKPILILFTIPITVLTLGLFLFVINAAIILLTDKLIDGFFVKNFWWALLLSLCMSLLGSLTQGEKR